MAWRYCPVGVQGTVLGIAVDFERLALSIARVVVKESRADVGRGGASPQTSDEVKPAESTLEG